MENVTIGFYNSSGERQTTFRDILQSPLLLNKLIGDDDTLKKKLEEYISKNNKMGEVQLPEKYQKLIADGKLEELKTEFKKDAVNGTFFGHDLEKTFEKIEKGDFKSNSSVNSNKRASADLEGENSQPVLKFLETNKRASADLEGENPYTNQPRTWTSVINVNIDDPVTKQKLIEKLDLLESMPEGQKRFQEMAETLKYYKEEKGVDFGKYNFTANGEEPNFNISSELLADNSLKHSLNINTDFISNHYTINSNGELSKINDLATIFHETSHGIDKNLRGCPR
jgi:hypothetical protein